MQFISYVHAGKAGFGTLDNAGKIVDLGGPLGCADLGHALRTHGGAHLLETAARRASDWALQDISAYRPVVSDPSQVFCVGLNYDEHRVEANRARTDHPTIFLRVPSSQTGHEQPLILPPESSCLDYEGEIAVVIGKGGRRIKPEHAFDHILGFSAYNDASIRDWQAHTTQWTPGKNFPATGAFGPTLVLAEDVGEHEVLTLSTYLNGEQVQSATTDMMLFPIPELLAYLSTFTTLMPGDVIVTGTPGGVGFKRNPPLYLCPGDVVEVDVSRVGRLRNVVQRETLPA
jgi:2-keto-4-pentenoate hydratase/2-oxohepta-3-ene-1,7-dioic acid hydratase in catechol pathway